MATICDITLIKVVEKNWEQLGGLFVFFLTILDPLHLSQPVYIFFSKHPLNIIHSFGLLTHQAMIYQCSVV